MSIEQSQSFSRWYYRKEALVVGLLEWVPFSLGKVLRRLVYRTIFARIGTSVQILPGVEFQFVDRIEIGNRIALHRGVRITCRGQNSKICIRDNVILDCGVDIKAHSSADIEIGENTYIGPYTCLSGDHIKIGKYCLMASHIGIYANNHGFADPTRKIQEQASTYKGIVIEDDCWLGTGVKVLDGVTIGQGSVIGAGAVVTKDIPPYSIAVGVPAKVISKRNGTRDNSVVAEAYSVIEATKAPQEAVL